TPPNPVSDVKCVMNLETLYIEWKAPVDPCPLLYEISFPTDNDHTIVTEVTKASKKNHQNGFFTITAIDEVGNRSNPISQDFIFTAVLSDKLYTAPNPVQSKDKTFKIFFFINNFNKTVELSIYNIAGQLVWEKKYSDLEKGEHEATVNAFVSGVYIAKLKTDKIVKSHKFAIIQ
ncbi:MAG: T9SS type A sorting domain-containing protein, partial [Candidatus Cloacimonetes bacterium]|nr:T9SS type A sorting domain-containing protein [Candidatus Cloacimonadota bacterium]